MNYSPATCEIQYIIHACVLHLQYAAAAVSKMKQIDARPEEQVNNLHSISLIGV